MSQPFKTDSLRPSSLPSATLGRRREHLPSSSLLTAADSSLTPEERAKQALDKEHERWNERIDKEVKGCVDGLQELVELADISANPNPLTPSTLPLHLPLRTSALIRSALNIRDIAHELKLMLLLSDEIGTAQARDRERELVRGDIERGRDEVVREARILLGADIGGQAVEKEREAQAQKDGEPNEKERAAVDPTSSPAKQKSPAGAPEAEGPGDDVAGDALEEDEDDEDMMEVDVPAEETPAPVGEASAPVAEVPAPDVAEDSDEDFDIVNVDAAAPPAAPAPSVPQGVIDIENSDSDEDDFEEI
ncbi:hypothetical protein IAT38_007811 [Cryptococcus sp. DSM 104549]